MGFNDGYIENEIEIVPRDSSKKKPWKRCCICKATSASHPERRFFRFPKDPVRSKQWTTAIGKVALMNLPPSSLYLIKRVCSEHFTDDSYATSKKHFLNQKAVPSNFFHHTLRSISNQIRAKLKPMPNTPKIEISIVQSIPQFPEVPVSGSTPQLSIQEKATNEVEKNESNLVNECDFSHVNISDIQLESTQLSSNEDQASLSKSPHIVQVHREKNNKLLQEVHDEEISSLIAVNRGILEELKRSNEIKSETLKQIKISNKLKLFKLQKMYGIDKTIINLDE